MYPDKMNLAGKNLISIESKWINVLPFTGRTKGWQKYTILQLPLCFAVLILDILSQSNRISCHFDP